MNNKQNKILSAKLPESDNSKLWNSVCETNPDMIKEVTFGRKFKSICAQYQVGLATREFGPMGIGWGVGGEEFDFIADGKMIFYRGVLWYKLAEKEGEINIYSAVEFVNAKSGKMDSDAYKKVATDALTKGLSKLGFSADVFTGLYDDNKYVQMMIDQQQDNQAPQQPRSKQIQKKVSKKPPSDIEANYRAIMSQVAKANSVEVIHSLHAAFGVKGKARERDMPILIRAWSESTEEVLEVLKMGGDITDYVNSILSTMNK